MSKYLIYHPKRQETEIDGIKIYHDKFGGNEDPYIWNDNFLHTYCHITQLSNEIDQINFWISGDTYPNFTKLYCDCVFVIENKYFWKDRNHIDRNDPIVDNDQAFEHNYKWAAQGSHTYKRRRRYTLKAYREKSFQPQDSNNELIDILPFLNQNGLDTNYLIDSITSKKGSRPFKLNDDLGLLLYNYLYIVSSIKIFGTQIKDKHPNWGNNKINNW